MIVGVTLMEFHLMYAALVGGHAPLELPPASATTTSAADNTFSSTLTVESPQIRAWTKF